MKDFTEYYAYDGMACSWRLVGSGRACYKVEMPDPCTAVMKIRTSASVLSGFFKLEHFDGRLPDLGAGSFILTSMSYDSASGLELEFTGDYAVSETVVRSLLNGDFSVVDLAAESLLDKVFVAAVKSDLEMPVASIDET